MANITQIVLLFLATLLLVCQFSISQAQINNKNVEKTAIFLSPKIEMGQGSVIDKFYYNIDFPKGHIGLKSFNAELVNEKGEPVPLHETYIHHWLVDRYYQRKDVSVPKNNAGFGFHASDRVQVRNSGLCKNTLGQYFGLGSETRRTLTQVPDPYAIEVGNPSDIPQGYEEMWVLNVHAIDTRGVQNRLGCTECKCDLYNVTKRSNGQPLRPNYEGGLECCYDETQCKLREGVQRDQKRALYMRYTVKWIDWDDSIVPVRIYILDVTDLNGRGQCMVEYNVESCSNENNNDCIDSKRVTIHMPIGGNVIYGAAHQHTGGTGSTLYGQDGRVICTSLPTYGQGKEAGDEQGYIVGMSTCYPSPGLVKIHNGESLVLESNYSKDQLHNGVMGLFYILLADDKSTDTDSILNTIFEKHEKIGLSSSAWGIGLFGVAIVITMVVIYRRRSERDDGYQSISV